MTQSSDLITVRNTDEQLASLEASDRNESHVIDALAGTGKTRQLLQMAQRRLHRDPNRKILIIVFGHQAAEMIRERVTAAGLDPEKVKVSTAHSLAYGPVGRLYKERMSEDGELGTAVALAESSLLERFSPPDATAFATTVVDTLARYCSSAQRAIGIEHMPPGLESDVDAEAILEAANLVWADFAEVSHSLPIWHDVYLKLFALREPKLKFDDLLFDEGNDASPNMFDIVMRQKNKFKVVVGDENQAIFAWRGAINALQLLDLPRYPQTQCFRFGPNIAEYANRILEKKGAKLRLRGVAEDPGRVVASSAEAANVILARTNAGMFEAAIDLVSHGKSISVSGSIKKHITLLLAAYDLYGGRTPSHPSLAALKSWTALVTASKSEQGSRLAPYVRLIEKYQKETPKIAAKLSDNAKAPSKGGVRLSTTHGLKGDSDAIVELWPDFDSFIEKGAINVEEANLWYVAMTRAEKVLVLGKMNALATQVLGEPKIETLKTEPRAVYGEEREVLTLAPPAAIAPELPLAPDVAAPAPPVVAVLASVPVATSPAPSASDVVPPPAAPRKVVMATSVEDRLAADLDELPSRAAAAAAEPGSAPPAVAPASGPSAGTLPPAASALPGAPDRPAAPPRNASSTYAPSARRARTPQHRPRTASLPTPVNVEREDWYRVARMGARRSPIGWMIPAGADLSRFEPWLEAEQAESDYFPEARVTPSAEPRHLIAVEPTVALLMGASAWKRVVMESAAAANGTCPSCGRGAELEPHADLRITGIVARFERVRSLCEACHRLAHIERGQDAVLVADLVAVNGEERIFAAERLARARKAQAKLDRRWYLLGLPETIEVEVAREESATPEVSFKTRVSRMLTAIAFG